MYIYLSSYTSTVPERNAYAVELGLDILSHVASAHFHLAPRFNNWAEFADSCGQFPLRCRWGFWTSPFLQNHERGPTCSFQASSEINTHGLMAMESLQWVTCKFIFFLEGYCSCSPALCIYTGAWSSDQLEHLLQRCLAHPSGPRGMPTVVPCWLLCSGSWVARLLVEKAANFEQYVGQMMQVDMPMFQPIGSIRMINANTIAAIGNANYSLLCQLWNTCHMHGYIMIYHTNWSVSEIWS